MFHCLAYVVDYISKLYCFILKYKGILRFTVYTEKIVFAIVKIVEI